MEKLEDLDKLSEMVAPTEAKGGGWRIETDAKWYQRIWLLVSFPFRYIIKGEIRL